MVGIVSYGAYIPFSRLSREEIGKAWGARGGAGEKAVAKFDEDSITMAVDAGLDCLSGIDRNSVDGLFLATTTPPYREKMSAAVVAAALDLPRQARVADFGHSLRAATLALNSALDAVKAGSLKLVLVIAADCRMGAPLGEFEQLFGDGAAAVLVGDKSVAASVVDSYSVHDDILDVWRTSDDVFVRSWEDRFVVGEGYSKVIPEAVTGLMKQSGLGVKDFARVAIYGHDVRSHAALMRSLGFDAKTQVQDPLFDKVGHSGAAQALLSLVASLQSAKPGDKVLLASYGDGSDAFALQVTDQIENLGEHRGVKGHLEPKKLLSNYQKYLRWRGLVPTEPARRPPLLASSPAARHREGKRITALYAQKCQQCGEIQYHPLHRLKVCSFCNTQDKFEDVRLSDKKGQVYTFSQDYLGATVDPPIIYTTVDFEGGGRLTCEMTNADPSEVKVGMPVEMCFRKLYTEKGIHNYFWKSRPIR
ncbi:MAG: OB-fold domain-containing protein [Chloroflexota bacterium]|nr:OB-fold domain-containing protein [Chloroflexota bacterium]